MRKIAALAVIGGMALAGGVATAHDTEYVSEVSLFEGSALKGFPYAIGAVTSKESAKCRRFREIQLRGVDKGEVLEIIDEGTTSKRGFWHLSGPVSKGVPAVDVKLVKSNIGPPGHKHICTADTEFLGSTSP
jgi:hypothetical protein